MTLKETELTNTVDKAYKSYIKLQNKHAELKGAYKEQAKTIQIFTELKTQAAETSKSVLEIKDVISKQQGTYADIVRVNEKLSSGLSQAASGRSTVAANRNPVKSNTKVLLIYPKEGNTEQTSEETKAAIQNKLKPTTLGLKIDRLIKIRNGSVAMQLSETQVEAVNDKIKEDFQIKVPVPNKPKIKIYDIPSYLAQENVIEDIRQQNFSEMSKEEFGRNFKFLFKVGPRDQSSTQWIVEISKELRNKLNSQSGRVYLGWRACKSVDYVIITRCYRCQRFGHLAKDCRADTETCSHCAKDGHNIKNCPDKEWNYRCSNCAKAKLKNNHNVSAITCPSYLKEKERIQSLIDYGQ